MSLEDTMGSESEKVPGAAGEPACRSVVLGALFLPARLLALGPRPFLLQDSALPPQIPHSSFWQVLTAPTKPTVCFHDQQAFLSPPATLRALAGHVPIYFGLLHWPTERRAQGCAQICRYLKRSTGGWVKLAKVHGTLL